MKPKKDFEAMTPCEVREFLEQRFDQLSKIREKVDGRIKKEQEKWEDLRAKLLGVKSGKIPAFNYRFPLVGTPIEKEDAIEHLNSLGGQRYFNGGFKVFVNETWNTYSVSLRWPHHYAGWVDNITLFSSGGLAEELSVNFMRSKQKDGSKVLYSDAEEIYQTLKKMLG
jgi:hypothetical protein